MNPRTLKLIWLFICLTLTATLVRQVWCQHLDSIPLRTDTPNIEEVRRDIRAMGKEPWDGKPDPADTAP